MTHLRRLAVLSLLFFLPVVSALAAPKQGFGLFGGIASHTSTGEFTTGDLDGESFTISSSGIGIGVDYQLPIAEHISINFLLQTSSESASSSELDIDSAGHGILGVEARYWFEDYFAGIRVGRYSEAIASTDEDVKSTTTGAGIGYGLSVGWAKPEGLFIVGQFDNATIEYNDAEAKLTGIRANIGYRWGN